ncbi:MAG: LacI family DNA-binding transcriptional regulator, partial [Terrimicrobiaceae bacterium]|nr:LacI family DNA-binding transcriptional regulator [Terrimicrobiaceae bacterium]
MHKATVSRSLRNHPTIPIETRQRIQQIAKDLGYRPNPLVSMFQSQARSSRPEKMKAALGWLNDYPQESCWIEFPWLRGYYEGARLRCEEMGYRLETLQVKPEGRSFSEEHHRI